MTRVQRSAVQPPDPNEWELVEYGWNPLTGEATFVYEREIVEGSPEQYTTTTFQPIFQGVHVTQDGLPGDPWRGSALPW